MPQARRPVQHVTWVVRHAMVQMPITVWLVHLANIYIKIHATIIVQRLIRLFSQVVLIVRLVIQPVPLALELQLINVWVVILDLYSIILVIQLVQLPLYQHTPVELHALNVQQVYFFFLIFFKLKIFLKLICFFIIGCSSCSSSSICSAC